MNITFKGQSYNPFQNFILLADSYKTGMHLQYPDDAEDIVAYGESRGGKWNETLVFGLQAFIKEYLLRPITQLDIDFAEFIITGNGSPFNRQGWQDILSKYNGFMPLRIKSVPEGTVLTVKNIMYTVQPTDPAFVWLNTYVETALLRAFWYPTTVASNSYQMRKLITKWLIKNGTPESVNYKLHDFGARGVSSNESAMLGGMAHLAAGFNGTDNLMGRVGAWAYYNATAEVGTSIPAAEHSTITSWGVTNEDKAYANMIKQFGIPGGMYAVVSDSNNIYEACEYIWGEKLRQQVIDSGATLVIRPDSGDPVVVCATIIEILGDRFGYTVNDKGYKVLNYVRIIQGDGIDYDTVNAILDDFDEFGWSADNIAFGQGGALLQIVNRDDQKFAQKCCAIKRAGLWYGVSKNPITDPGKKSKEGLVDLIYTASGYKSGIEGDGPSALQIVYENGKLYNETTFAQIRARQ